MPGGPAAQVAGTLPHALLGPEHTEWPPAWPWSLKLLGQFGEPGHLVWGSQLVGEALTLPPLTPASPLRLAPMRLYTLSKHHFVLVFVVFFVCFGLTVFVGIRGEEQLFLFFEV